MARNRDSPWTVRFSRQSIEIGSGVPILRFAAILYLRGIFVTHRGQFITAKATGEEEEEEEEGTKGTKGTT